MKVKLFLPIILLLLLFGVGVASAGVITPPLADDPSLILRYSFDDIKGKNVKESFENGYGMFTPYTGTSGGGPETGGASVNITSEWASDGQYSVNLTAYNPNSDREYWAGINCTFDTPITGVLSLDVYVEKCTSEHHVFQVIVDGSTVYSTSQTGIHHVFVEFNNATSIKIQVHADYDEYTEIIAFVDNVRIVPIVKDDSGNGNDGYCYGPNRVLGHYGYALSFDGEDDYVKVTDPAEVRFPANTSFTIALWYNSIKNYPDGTGAFQYLVYKGGAGYFAVGVTPSGLGTFEWNTKVLKGTFVTDGKFHLIVAVRDENGVGYLYVDGKLVASGFNEAGEVANTSSDLFIGQRSDGAYKTVGIIDEVRIYNRSLSDEEIKAMYEALRVKFYDESNNTKIKADATMFNSNYSINLQVDNITKEAVLFHADVPEYGKYQVKVEADGYAPRYYGVNLTDDKRVELDTYLPPASQAILLTFQVVDYTNTFYSLDTTLSLSKPINNRATIVFEKPLDVEHKCQAYVIADDQYVVSLRNSQEMRSFGYISASMPDTITIIVQNPLQFSVKQYIPVTYNITNDNGTIIIQYETLEGNTTQASVEIYNSSGDLVFTSTANTPYGKFVYYGDPNEIYSIHFHVSNDVEPLEIKIISKADTGWLSIQVNVQTITQLPEWFRLMFFGGLCLFVALLFKRSHVPIGLMLSFSLAAVFTSMGILPLNQSLLWVLAILVGLSFFVWWRDRR